MGCDIIVKDDDISSCYDEATEFVQGLLGLFHITAHFSDMPKVDTDLVIQLSQAMLHCLEKFRERLREVEAIAGNFFLNLWNLANKTSTCSPDHTLRSFSLRILIHSGTQHWTKMIDRMLMVTANRADASIQLVEEVLDHFMICISQRPGDHETLQMSILLSLWVLLLNISDHQRQDGRTRRLVQLASKTGQKSEQYLMSIDIVLSVVGAKEALADVDTKWPQLKDFLFKEMQLLFVIMAQLALHCSSRFINQSMKSSQLNSSQISAVYLVMSSFVENIDAMKVVIESHFQTDAKKMKMRFLPRTASVCCFMLKMDPSSSSCRAKELDLLLQSAEHLVLAFKPEEEKSVTSLFSAIGNSFTIDLFYYNY